MAYPGCPMFNCCPSPAPSQCFNNPYSGCSLLKPPSSSLIYNSKCPGTFANFVNGNSEEANPCCPKPCPKPRCCPQRECCPPPPPQRCIRPSPRPACCPPACIQTKCAPPPGRNPSERLRNVDVLEELCYYAPSGGSDENYSCYAVCNCCGSPEPVPCPCPSPGPPNPVKYNRRQRFTFEEEGGGKMEDGPCWPFDERPFQHHNPEGVAGCCGAQHTQNHNQHQQQCRSSRSEDDQCKEDNQHSGKPEDVLPRKTGVYYFDSRRRTFIPQEELPKPPEVCILSRDPNNEESRGRRRSGSHRKSDQRRRSREPAIQEFEVFEEDRGRNNHREEPEVVIQPVIQPVYMPAENQNQNYQNQCGYNPMMGGGGCNPMMLNNQMLANSILPMCILMCQPQCQQQPPPPMYPGMYPGMHPGMYPGMSGKKKKKKKDKKTKKKKSSKMEETTIEYVDRESVVNTALYSPYPYSPYPPYSYPYPPSGGAQNSLDTSAMSPYKPKSDSYGTGSGGTGDAPPPARASPTNASPTKTNSSKSKSGYTGSYSYSSSSSRRTPTDSGSGPPTAAAASTSPVAEGYSRNIIVGGGPANMAGNRPPPPGAYSESMTNSSVTVASGRPPQQPPPGASGVNIKPVATVEESNPNFRKSIAPRELNANNRTMYQDAPGRPQQPSGGVNGVTNPELRKSIAPRELNTNNRTMYDTRG